jgi:hypothetical protein
VFDRLTEVTGFGSNPGALRMFEYVPTDPQPALVIVLHGCTQTAASYDFGAGWSTLAALASTCCLREIQLDRRRRARCFAHRSAPDRKSPNCLQCSDCRARDERSGRSSCWERYRLPMPALVLAQTTRLNGYSRRAMHPISIMSRSASTVAGGRMSGPIQALLAWARKRAKDCSTTPRSSRSPCWKTRCST